MNKRTWGVGMTMLFAIATLGVGTGSEGCSSSSSSSNGDDCTAVCGREQGKTGCSPSGVDGGPDCVTQCKSPSSIGVTAACTSQWQQVVHCAATTGAVASCNALTGFPLVSGCDTEYSAVLQCLFQGLDASFTID